MQSKLNLNRELVDKARASAAHIAADTQSFIDVHTLSARSAACSASTA